MSRCHEASKNQSETLHMILKRNKQLYQLIRFAENCGLADYYIGAGSIAQTVWNDQSGHDLMYGISDFDFVYYDPDLSEEKEKQTAGDIRRCFPGGVAIDVKNEARVHLWYREHFGYEIPQYPSLEAAIDTWPTTATAVGVRLQDSRLFVYAPFGLDDLFGRVVRANKAQITREIYETKVKKWVLKWPDLTVIPW